MKKILNVLAVALILASCKDEGGGKKFEVNGTISNSPENIVYLEAVPLASMRPVIVDSAKIEAGGKFVLKTKTKEACTYIIRVGNSRSPLAAVINDVSKVTVNASFPKGASYTQNYEVSGSKASGQLKEFMTTLNTQLQKIYFNAMAADSLRGTPKPDSALAALQEENHQITVGLRELLTTSIQQSENPALTMFELGNYQGIQRELFYNLIPLSNEEVSKIITETAEKFRSHTGIQAVKKQWDADMATIRKQPPPPEKNWVGKQAPEISLPDVNGNVVTLSSYKGKYVLVDFWASWCPPCRAENPNVVAMYNKFKGKNFDILGVSLDKPGEKNKWLQAIKDDKLAWTQVSELKWWNSEVVDIFGFAQEGIPYNILVDPQGVIIGERLTGADLERKLEEVLK